ncbi:MAG: SufD family Fe-S cluster assembly protein [Minisyncoccia bacterium]
MIDYFTNCVLGEAYVYGLKCTTPLFEVDEREVIFVTQGEEKKIRIIHNSNSRKFLQIHVARNAKVDVEIILIAKEGCVLDSYIEILHEGDTGKSALVVRGYTEGNGRIISRIRTHVPHEVFHVHAIQNVQLYQFETEGVVDCIPILEIQNKTTVSSHAVRLEKINESEYWQATRSGISESFYQDLKKESLGN